MKNFTGFGWMKPDGKIIQTGQYRHWTELMGEHAAEVADHPELEKGWQEVKDAEQGCQELEDRGEHGEWHCYDMELGRFESMAYQTLYDHGWLRIGKRQYEQKIVLEGRVQHMVNLTRKIARMILEFNEDHGVKYETQLDPKAAR